MAERVVSRLEFQAGMDRDERTAAIRQERERLQREQPGVALRERVLVASGGAEALQMSQRHAGPIQLLLTDVVMPSMSGPELARQLAGQRPGTAVLYMTGYADEAHDGQAVPEEESAVLSKPFTPAELT